MCKLSISNIAWGSENDAFVCELMQKTGFNGLEIAPTRIFPENPYDKLKEARSWSEKLNEDYGFKVSSMQSIWFGKSERIFASYEEREILIEYTKKAIDFADAINCKNLVFGCPKNRNIPENFDENDAIDFFKTIANYAESKNTVIGMEANPPIYNTNFINDTKAALKLISKVDSPGFKLNLDVGTMIENSEEISVIKDCVHYINHVHISEPYLKPILKRSLHKELSELLLKENYEGFVSIEMGKTEDMSLLEEKMEYVKGLFK